MTFTTEQVRRLYSCAYAWRTAEREGESDLEHVRAQQAAEFDSWLADHDRRVTAKALRDAAEGLIVVEDGARYSAHTVACTLRARAELVEKGQDGDDDDEGLDDCPACDAAPSDCSRDDVCCADCNHSDGWSPAESETAHERDARRREAFRELLEASEAFEQEAGQ